MFKLIWHFIADTDTDEHLVLEYKFRCRSRHSCSSQLRVGSITDRNCFRQSFVFLADTDTKKSYFRVISVMNVAKTE